MSNTQPLAGVYVCHGEHVNSSLYLGLFSGDISDIQAYIVHNHPAYSHRWEQASITTIPAGYANKLVELCRQEEQLKAQLAKLQSEIKLKLRGQ